MSPVWIELGYRLTSAVCKEMFNTIVLSWIKKITYKSDYDVQQDRTPANTAKTAQNWLDANMSFWAPQSPDLNRVDFSLWTQIEEKTSKTCHSNTGKFKASVNRAWRSMKKSFARKVCKRFRLLLEHFIDTKVSPCYKSYLM